MEEELHDSQWMLIAPLLPQHKGRGRPRANDRRTLNSILGVLRSGACRKELPRRYGSRSTCHRRLLEWHELRGYGIIPVGPASAPWTSRASWIGARLSWMAALSQPKRGQDIAYGWKGKRSTVHLVTEGDGGQCG